jgi:hypothetical protein
MNFETLDPRGNAIARCQDIAAATLLASFYGEGSTVWALMPAGRRVLVWTEGSPFETGDEARNGATLSESALRRLMADLNLAA